MLSSLAMSSFLFGCLWLSRPAATARHAGPVWKQFILFWNLRVAEGTERGRIPDHFVSRSQVSCFHELLARLLRVAHSIQGQGIVIVRGPRLRSRSHRLGKIILRVVELLRLIGLRSLFSQSHHLRLHSGLERQRSQRLPFALNTGYYPDEHEDYSEYGQVFHRASAFHRHLTPSHVSASLPRTLSDRARPTQHCPRRSRASRRPTLP